MGRAGLGRGGPGHRGQRDLGGVADEDLDLAIPRAPVPVLGDHAADDEGLADGAGEARPGQDIGIEEDQGQRAAAAGGEEDAGRAAAAVAHVLADREHLDLGAQARAQLVERAVVPEDDVPLVGPAPERLDEGAAGVPPGPPLVVVGVVAEVGIPDAAAGGAGLALGRQHLAVVAGGMAVLGEVRAHAGAHGLDVVVDPATVLLDQRIGEVAAVAVAALGGVIALEAHLGDAGEEAHGEAARLLAERAGSLHRPRRCAAQGTQEAGPVGVGGPAVGGPLERLLGVEADQPQRVVEADDPQGVAVGDLLDREHAEEEVGIGGGIGDGANLERRT
jgi:hypothetical protein